MSSSPIASFERELLQKIRQKSRSKDSIDSFLFKAFKFFDLSNNGRLSQDHFFKAIAKCGVVVQPADVRRVFEHYVGPSDVIQYGQFITRITEREQEIDSNSNRLKFSKSNAFPQESRLTKNSQEDRQPKNEGKAISPIKLNSYDQVLQYIKATLQTEGLGSLLTLAVGLKQADKSKSHSADRNTLSQLIPFLAKEHISLIFAELAQKADQIDYSVLVYDLKGQIDEQVTKEIDNTFAFLDGRREGEFPIEYLLSRFLSRSQEESFRRAVDLYARFQGIDDGTFTEDDFNDFLGFLSFDYNSVQDFRTTIIRPFFQYESRSSLSHKSNRTRDFQLNKSQKGSIADPPAGLRKDKREEEREEYVDEQVEDKKSVVSRYSQFLGQSLASSNKLKVFQSVILRIKKRLASKGTKGFLQLERAMKQADSDQDTLLTAEEFTQVIRGQRIDITAPECNNVFELFDNEGTELISFAEFMFTLRGRMPEQRREMVEKLWGQIRSGDDTTSLSKLRHLLNFRAHPDVQNGRRHEDDIWKEIQETILAIQELNGLPRSDAVSKQDFQEYMQNLSLSIIDDRLFQTILLHFWRLDNSSSILERYAGSRKLFDHTKNGYLMDHHRNYVQGGSVSQNAPFGTFHQPTSYTTEHRKL